MRSRSVFWSTFFIFGLSGCGSPIFDHRIKAKPKRISSVDSNETGKSESIRAGLLKLESVPENCEFSFKNSNLCVEIYFERKPRFLASLETFEAALRIWNSDTKVWETDVDEIRIYHSNPMVCCMAPEVKVNQLSAGQYLLSEIEFHAVGDFEFLVEAKDKSTGKKLKAVVWVEVFE